MENSPLSDGSVAEEENTSSLDSTSRHTLNRELPASRTRPRGAGTRVGSWMRVGAVDWGIRIAVVGLVIGGFFAVYVNGVAGGWWHAWGETPTVAATGPTVQPTPAPTVSSEPAMSGGYQIGPDGILVRPAEYAADTYTKPELPEAAKENSERGAELAAEHYVATLSYAWNTGDTQTLATLSAEKVPFADGHINAINSLYLNGWAYGNAATITSIVEVEPVAAETGAPPNTVGVLFHITTTNGTSCQGQRIVVSDKEYTVSFALFMTWQGDRWLVTDGNIPHGNDK